MYYFVTFVHIEIQVDLTPGGLDSPLFPITPILLSVFISLVGLDSSFRRRSSSLGTSTYLVVVYYTVF